MSSVEELCENISLVNCSKIMLQGNVAEIRASHTNHTFNIRSTQAISGNKIELLEQKTDKNGIYESKIKKDTALTNNELLKELMSQAEIIGFEEVLPSMNDIFIDIVKASPNPSKEEA